jgi:hypothetical protein
MVWHYDRSMKLKAFPVIIQTVLEHGVTGFRRKRGSIALSNSHE